MVNVQQMSEIIRQELVAGHLPVKGNKKRAEAMLDVARKDFIPTLWDGDNYIIQNDLNHAVASGWIDYK